VGCHLGVRALIGHAHARNRKHAKDGAHRNDARRDGEREASIVSSSHRHSNPVHAFARAEDDFPISDMHETVAREKSPYAFVLRAQNARALLMYIKPRHRGAFDIYVEHHGEQVRDAVFIVVARPDGRSVASEIGRASVARIRRHDAAPILH
jgi:hypothetical protein